MEHYNKIILFLIAFFSIISCKLNAEKKNTGINDFYKYSRDGDIIRIPLKQPYELYSADNGDLWFLDFEFGTKINKDKIDGVDSIGLRGDFIIAYCKNTYVVNNGMVPMWFVADVKNKIETIFLIKSEYDNFLIEKNLKLITLYSPKDIFNNFDKSGVLPW